MKHLLFSLLIGALSLGVVACGDSAEEEPNTTPDDTCVPTITFYQQKVRPTVTTVCASCHLSSGTGGATRHVVVPDDDAATRASLRVVAEEEIGGLSLLLAKASNQVTHTGGAQVAEGTQLYADLEELVERINNPVACDPDPNF